MGRAASQSRDLVVVPSTRRDIDAVARQCRKLATRRALISAGASVTSLAAEAGSTVSRTGSGAGTG